MRTHCSSLAGASAMLYGRASQTIEAKPTMSTKMHNSLHPGCDEGYWCTPNDNYVATNAVDGITDCRDAGWHPLSIAGGTQPQWNISFDWPSNIHSVVVWPGLPSGSFYGGSETMFNMGFNQVCDAVTPRKFCASDPASQTFLRSDSASQTWPQIAHAEVRVDNKLCGILNSSLAVQVVYCGDKFGSTISISLSPLII